MNHINEDIILKYALDVIEDENERAAIEEHLKTCAECLDNYRKIISDMDIIGSIETDARTVSFPSGESKRGIVHGLLKVAAVFIIGFIIGFGSSNTYDNERITVYPSYFEPEIPPDSVVSYTAADATILDFE